MTILLWSAVGVLVAYGLLRERQVSPPRPGHRMSLAEFLFYDMTVLRALIEWSVYEAVFRAMNATGETLRALEQERNERVHLSDVLAAAVERWEAEQWPPLRGWKIFLERETVTGVLWVWNAHCKGFQIGFIWWRFCLHYWSEE